MRAERKIPIDGARLQAEARKRGETLSSISKEIGRAESYLSNCINRGAISLTELKLIEAYYGITADDIRPEPAKAPNPNKTPEIILVPEISDEQWARLGEIVKAAILEAMKEL